MNVTSLTSWKTHDIVPNASFILEGYIYRDITKDCPFTLHAPIFTPALEVYGMRDVMSSIKFATILYNYCRPRL
jgi:hypothetical protein